MIVQRHEFPVGQWNVVSTPGVARKDPKNATAFEGLRVYHASLGRIISKCFGQCCEYFTHILSIRSFVDKNPFLSKTHSCHIKHVV